MHAFRVIKYRLHFILVLESFIIIYLITILLQHLLSLFYLCATAGKTVKYLVASEFQRALLIARIRFIESN